MNFLDFSCGLWFTPAGRAIKFPLARYNGKSHKHTNHLEREGEFYDFHIHRATARYQDSSHDDDHYAEVTDRYAQLSEAFACLLDDCNISRVAEDDGQTDMFQ